MFNTKQPKLAWIYNAVIKNKDKFEVKQVGTSKDKLTIDEYEQLTIESIKAMFADLREKTKTHEVTVGIFVAPLVHVIHDDEMGDDPKWIKAKKQILSYFK